MALIKDSLGKNEVGAQYKLVASGSIASGDMAVQTDDHVLFALPAGSVVTAASIHVTTVFTASVEKLDVDLVDMAGANPIVVAAATDALVLGRTDAAGAAITGDALTEPHYVVIRNDVAGNTAGEATVDVEYYIQGRANENTG